MKPSQFTFDFWIYFCIPFMQPTFLQMWIAEVPEAKFFYDVCTCTLIKKIRNIGKYIVMTVIWYSINIIASFYCKCFVNFIAVFPLFVVTLQVMYVHWFLYCSLGGLNMNGVTQSFDCFLFDNISQIIF